MGMDDAIDALFVTVKDELIALIDRFDHPLVTCCWDSGHARLAFTRAGMPDAMRALGSRITCTHIHDNYYNRDLHVLPFQGDIDWREQMATLKEIGYKGDLSFETVRTPRTVAKFDPELVQPWLDLICKTGESFRRKILEG